MKKILTNLFIVIAVVLSLGVLVSYAETTTTIKIYGASDKHKYEAYQVFSGKLSKIEGKNDQMVDVEWGNGVNGDALLTAVKASLCSTCDSAQAVANWLDKTESPTVDDTENAQAFAKLVSQNLKDGAGKTSSYVGTENNEHHEITLSDEGYYFIKDINNLANQNEAYTRYLLKVFGASTNISVKADLPNFEKKILNGTTAQSSIVEEIGVTVTYQLKVDLPSTFGDFPVYKLVLHDEMSSGLTYDTSYGFKVYLDKTGNGTTTEITSGSYFTMEKNDEDGSVELVFTAEDITKITDISASSSIIIEYKAQVNNSANAGTLGNTNTAYLEFSNNPNETNGATLGKTVTKDATVYTYELNITKKDGKNDEVIMAGVKFKLCKDSSKNSCAKFDTKSDGTYVLKEWTTFDGATELVTNSTAKIKIHGLKNTKYYLFETETKQGYNILKEPKEVNITLDSTNNTYTMSITIENLPGALLPSTGGIGTIIFYIIGGFLILFAIILIIIVKKKDEDEEESEAKKTKNKE